jgi:peroxiredoxin (alkyl hydroperoxide reductase subunit C)
MRIAMALHVEEKVPVHVHVEEKILQVGKPAPCWKMQGLAPDGKFKEYSLEDYRGKWAVLFYYPLDFTPVCQTEVDGFKALYPEFKKLNAEVFGVSIDSVHSHKAWVQSHHNGQLPYPLLSDITKEVSKDYGVLIEDQGITLRGIFIIDPQGILQWQCVHSLNVGRNTDEVLRVLQALQSGGLCGVNWKPGQKHLSPPQ